MPEALESNKTKIARRVIEVFEFFAAENRRATVMDIVRRYGRPQSSTSELLGALVEMGLLYKDPHSRSYAPTPRLAALGAAAQPEAIGSGRLFAYMDRLAQATRCPVGLFGMVGTWVQVQRWSPGGEARPAPVGCGDSVLLSSSAAGLLLLSSLGVSQAGRVLWRLNAEAAPADRFNLAEANEQVARFAETGHATGAAGFARDARVTAVLLPADIAERQLAIGVVHGDAMAVDSDALVAAMRNGLAQFSGADIDSPAPFVPSLVAV